jgi:hypothetical protein
LKFRARPPRASLHPCRRRPSGMRSNGRCSSYFPIFRAAGLEQIPGARKCG